METQAVVVMDGQKVSKADGVLALRAPRARLTIVSKKSGTHHAYRIKPMREAYEDDPRRQVAVLGAGGKPTWVGTLFCVPGKPIQFGAKVACAGAAALTWVVDHVVGGEGLDAVEWWHQGCCHKCGKKLHDPQSLARGFGPDCYAMMQAMNSGKVGA